MFQLVFVSGLLADRFSERDHLVYPRQVGSDQRHHRVTAGQFHSDHALVPGVTRGDKGEKLVDYVSHAVFISLINCSASSRVMRSS